MESDARRIVYEGRHTFSIQVMKSRGLRWKVMRGGLCMKEGILYMFYTSTEIKGVEMESDARRIVYEGRRTCSIQVMESRGSRWKVMRGGLCMKEGTRVLYK